MIEVHPPLHVPIGMSERGTKRTRGDIHSCKVSFSMQKRQNPTAINQGIKKNMRFRFIT